MMLKEGIQCSLVAFALCVKDEECFFVVSVVMAFGDGAPAGRIFFCLGLPRSRSILRESKKISITSLPSFDILDAF